MMTDKIADKLREHAERIALEQQARIPVLEKEIQELEKQIAKKKAKMSKGCE